MDKNAGQINSIRRLFAPTAPFQTDILEVGEGHSIYVEQSGNPDGIPVVVFHGGPGGGSSPAMRRYFDPKIYRIILFDQRGCGRSRPMAEVEANTTWHLISDIEHIRRTLGIERWIVFGGSWGATLALIYAIAQPECTAYLVLRGVFLMTKAELDWFYDGGAGAFWPDQWQDFIDPVPLDERDDLLAAYHKRLFGADGRIRLQFARAWSQWENALASIESTGVVGSAPPDATLAFARLENHYFVNGGFLQQDGWIEANLHRIAHIPASIVQGRYDMICPPVSAWKVARALPKSELKMVMAGHALSDVEITAELVSVMNRLHHKRQLLGL
ncbi:MAG: prolyl aminopeptidase [Rhodobacterales bacterium]|nr:MAG: prolyl aminopeptidase [Rhodobacterales bacterium]